MRGKEAEKERKGDRERKERRKRQAGRGRTKEGKEIEREKGEGEETGRERQGEGRKTGKTMLVNKEATGNHNIELTVICLSSNFPMQEVKRNLYSFIIFTRQRKVG